jgi:hypothetical protein
LFHFERGEGFGEICVTLASIDLIQNLRQGRG